MDEYIKKNEAVDVIVKYPYNIAGKTATAIKMIEDLPSADVVPKSEVDRLETEVRLLTENSISAKYPCCVSTSKGLFLTKSLEEYDKLLADISSEVAREVFEGIEKILVRPEAPTALFYHCSKHSYAELKKKYTEETK